ncbi:CRPV-366 [Crowpox virus]|nr:CRPV-366 [Crowpox virus]
MFYSKMKRCVTLNTSCFKNNFINYICNTPYYFLLFLYMLMYYHNNQVQTL